jgi:hypothetical protein
LQTEGNGLIERQVIKKDDYRNNKTGYQR